MCFSDPSNSGEDECITDMHFSMINGNNAVRLDLQNDNNRDLFNPIKPYSVEFGQNPGFSNVLVHPFHMQPSDYRRAKDIIEDSTETCYADTGTQYHSVTGNSYYGDQYYLRAEMRPITDYAHIHSHLDE